MDTRVGTIAGAATVTIEPTRDGRLHVLLGGGTTVTLGEGGVSPCEEVTFVLGVSSGVSANVFRDTSANEIARVQPLGNGGAVVFKYDGERWRRRAGAETRASRSRRHEVPTRRHEVPTRGLVSLGLAVRSDRRHFVGGSLALLDRLPGAWA